MESPQFKSGNVSVFNEKISLREFKNVDLTSIIGLYVSVTLMFLGILLILFNNLNILAPGSYFGARNWLTFVVFSIGLCINFISIPSLYFSSLKNFKKESEFWDKETFWILPLFFFGTFFLYNSLLAPALAMLVLSVIIIAFIHISFFLKASRISCNEHVGTLANYGQYVMTLKYLSAYYVVLLFLMISFDPISQAFIWIRLHT